MKVDIIEPVSTDRLRMNWFRAEWHVASMGKQAHQARHDGDYLTLLRMDEAAWHYINQFVDVNARHLRSIYELNSGQPKPAGWVEYLLKEAERKIAEARADERFVQANRDFLSDSWYEEADV